MRPQATLGTSSIFPDKAQVLDKFFHVVQFDNFCGIEPCARTRAFNETLPQNVVLNFSEATSYGL